MNRFKRYHRYFCRAVVALFTLACMAFIIWGIFEYKDLQMLIGLAVGTVTAIITVEHIWINAFRE